MTQTSFKDRIFFSSLYRVLGKVVTIAIAFLITPYLMRTLGAEGYGLWLLIMATLGWFTFVDLGFSAAVQRSIAIALEADDNHRINVVFSVSVVLFGALGLLAASMIFTLSLFPQLLGVDPEFHNIVHIALMLMCVKTIWDFGMYSLNGFYSGLIRFDVDANINTANETIKALLIVALVKDFHIYGAVAATLIADLLTNIFKIYYARRLFPHFRFDIKLVTLKEFKELFNYSKHVLAMTIAFSLSLGMDTLIISHLFGLSLVALYGVANRLVLMVEQMFMAVLGIFLPIFTRLIERKGNIQAEVEQVFALNYFLVSILLVPLIILSNDFFFLWLGAGFDEAYLIVAALSFAYICKTVSRPVSEVLLATAKHQYLSIVKLVGLTLNVVLSVALGSYLGLIGVALGTVASFWFSEVFLHLILYKRYTDYPISKLLFGFLRTTFLVALLASAGHYALAGVGQLSWIELMLTASVIFSISTIVFWYVSLNEVVRLKIIDQLRSKILRGSTSD